MRSVFITGATDGTGYAIARRYAEEGYAVFIGSRRQESAQAAAEKLHEKYGVPTKGYGYCADVSDEAGIKAIFDDIRAQGYLLDTLVLNAANLGIG
jgi:NAD(P)-dependent dehydrogenase (short-subunit alcohol dehydrogenase family)